jgi:hypothetical protein
LGYSTTRQLNWRPNAEKNPPNSSPVPFSPGSNTKFIEEY